MHPKSQDWLASTCPTYVGNITVRKNSNDERRGSDYYLQTDDGRVVLVASSFPQGNSIQYNWSTTEPVKHLNAPSTWDSNQMFTKVTGDYFMHKCAANLVTACSPHLFRQISAEYRFCREITPANWSAMELCPTLQELAYGEGLNQFTVKTKEQAWYISYADGCLHGLGWESFVIAHTLREDGTLVFSMDVDLNLVAMVFDQEGCERTFYWYTNRDDDATSFNQDMQ
ncbi:hypothetical protein RHGRI_007627 [Rhododendron griersonianum]|uniref:Fibrinogen C-terminal domain-containing protein n=1 Tax=Rhododendron griersonianum TaxID=479676 RepID=A0AAV6KY90_9ERIC|nr:hypothetical protein RHGRI_007627 [Rhododendron griersonianum]